MYLTEHICSGANLSASSSTDLRRLHIIDANPAKKFSAAALFLIFALYRAHKERGIIFNNFLKKCGGNVTWRPGHACIEQEVRTLRHGETVDLTALYETYSDLLFRTALTYVSHSEDAQDVVTMCLRSIWRSGLRSRIRPTNGHGCCALQSINAGISSAATRYAGIPL